MRRRRRARRRAAAPSSSPRPRPAVGCAGATAQRRPPARRREGADLRRAARQGRIRSPASRGADLVLTSSTLRDADLAALAASRRRVECATPRRGSVRSTSAARAPPTCSPAARREPQTAPDAVVSPASHAEVLAVLAACDARRIAVVPFGGGTSVVGGVDPDAGAHAHVIALDLSRTAGLIALDERRCSPRSAPGPPARRPRSCSAPAAARSATSRRATSSPRSAATPRRARAGRPPAATGGSTTSSTASASPPRSASCDLGRAPASAAGPDLRELFLGSEGAFGVLTEVTVRIRPRPAATAYGAWSFPDFEAGAEAFREATQRGIRPTVLRLSDGAETRVNAAHGRAPHADDADAWPSRRSRAPTPPRPRRRGRGSTRSSAPTAPRRAARSRPARGSAAGSPPPPCATRSSTWACWRRRSRRPRRGRAAGPQGRRSTDALTASLTADGTKPIVMCHISHVYPAGASLYFTVVAALTPEPAAQWRRAKDAASRAILAAGGTITHHHAVGRDHRPYLETEIGALGVEILAAVKRTLDPRGIMNPGALVRVGTPENRDGRQPRRPLPGGAHPRRRAGDRPAAGDSATRHAHQRRECRRVSTLIRTARRARHGRPRGRRRRRHHQSRRAAPRRHGRAARHRAGGTGNDFATHLGIPSSSRAPRPTSSRRVARASIDLARVDARRRRRAALRTVLASGFDSYVNDRANRMRWPRGERATTSRSWSSSSSSDRARTRSSVDGAADRRALRDGERGKHAHVWRRHPDLSRRRRDGRAARCHGRASRGTPAPAAAAAHRLQGHAHRARGGRDLPGSRGAARRDRASRRTRTATRSGRSRSRSTCCPRR